MLCKSCHSGVCDILNTVRGQVLHEVFPKIVELIGKIKAAPHPLTVEVLKKAVDPQEFEKAFKDIGLCSELRVALGMPPVV